MAPIGLYRAVHNSMLDDVAIHPEDNRERSIRQTTRRRTMSYCRWSSDNFNCDLYCFEHCGGWFQTYIAGARQRTWLKLFNWLTDRRLKIDERRTYRSSRFRTWALPHWLTHKPIKLTNAGKSFEDSSEEEMFDRILALHKEGFRVPQHLLDEAAQPRREQK
jgi:hypothetical protein